MSTFAYVVANSGLCSTFNYRDETFKSAISIGVSKGEGKGSHAPGTTLGGGGAEINLI